MTRTPYILREQELKMLLNGMISRGIDETYEAMKVRSLIAMNKSSDVDEILMDQRDAVLKKARDLQVENEKDEELVRNLLRLSAMLRTLAHEIYREYLKTDKERDNERFLRLVK